MAVYGGLQYKLSLLAGESLFKPVLSDGFFLHKECSVKHLPPKF